MSYRIIHAPNSHRLSSAVWKDVRSGFDGDGEDDAASALQNPVVQELLRKEREQSAREAHQKGFAEGLREGRHQEQQHLRDALERLAASIAAVHRSAQETRDKSVKPLVALALHIASRILHREINLDPEAITGLVRAGMERLQNRQVLRVKLHPAHQEPVRKLLDSTLPDHSIQLVPDSSFKLGDVILETPEGLLDASVTTQLGEIDRGLADSLKSYNQP